MPKIRSQLHAIIRGGSDYKVVSGSRWTELVIRDEHSDLVISIEKAALAQLIADLARPELEKQHQRAIIVTYRQPAAAV